MGRYLFWDIYIMRVRDRKPVRNNPTAGGMDRIIRDYAHCGGNGGKVRYDGQGKTTA